VKGGLVATLRRGPWLAEVTAEHELAIVTKFRDPLDYAMGTRPLFAQTCTTTPIAMSARSALATPWRSTGTGSSGRISAS
jgi:hypothetical protein